MGGLQLDELVSRRRAECAAGLELGADEGVLPLQVDGHAGHAQEQQQHQDDDDAPSSAAALRGVAPEC